MEYKLFDGDIPHVSTAAFHEHRERAPHLEQDVHKGRLSRAQLLLAIAYGQLAGEGLTHSVRVSDLGCGDGGFLQLIKQTLPRVAAWGYDFQPSNQAGWADRGVAAEYADVFGADRELIAFGDITITTEVLEHLADPHGAVRWIGENSRYLVASSPWTETPESHDECHAWAFDEDGYRALLEQAGFTVLRHELVGQFQVVLGEQR